MLPLRSWARLESPPTVSLAIWITSLDYQCTVFGLKSEWLHSVFRTFESIKWVWGIPRDFADKSSLSPCSALLPWGMFTLSIKKAHKAEKSFIYSKYFCPFRSHREYTNFYIDFEVLVYDSCCFGFSWQSLMHFFQTGWSYALRAPVFHGCRPSATLTVHVLQVFPWRYNNLLLNECNDLSTSHLFPHVRTTLGDSTSTAMLEVDSSTESQLKKLTLSEILILQVQCDIVFHFAERIAFPLSANPIIH